MQTSCPHCHTVFKVSDEHLKVADGYVRCGICKEVFNALEKDQPAAKKAPPANNAATGTAEANIVKNIASSTPAPAKPVVAEQKTKPSSSENLKPAVTPQKPLDPAEKTETTASGGTTQTDLFATPSNEIKPEPKPAPIAAKTAEARTSGSETTTTAVETGAPAAEVTAKAATKTEPIKEISNKTAVSATTPAPKSTPAPATTRSTSTAPNSAVSKNITYETKETVDDNLFDGVQSKLIPDEYRIPELHNTYSLWHDLAWSLAILVLTASLFAEYTWFNRNELISNPQLRPLVTQFCIAFNCNAMELRKPGEIEMTTRNIYTHPNVRNALMVSGTLVNHADFEQPYPNILIDFSDVRGEVIASRTFTPEDYLQIKATSLRPLPPRIPINFNMEIQDPGKNAMTYEFSFL